MQCPEGLQLRLQAIYHDFIIGYQSFGLHSTPFPPWLSRSADFKNSRFRNEMNNALEKVNKKPIR